MNAPAFLNRLQSLGVAVAVVGDDLELDAPSCVLTPKVLESVAALKPALLELLTGGTQSTLLPVPDSDHGSEEAARATQSAGVIAMFPDARRVRGGWLIEGAHHDHDNAVRLAAQRRGSTTNGYPLEWHARCEQSEVNR